MFLSDYDKFEITAMAFRANTGHWPPGKDWPSAGGPVPGEEKNRKAWDAWIAKHQPAIDAVLNAVVEYTD